MVALGVGGHHLDRHAGLAEHQDVGAASGAEQHLTGDDGLHEIGPASEGHELDVETLGLKKALVGGDDKGPGERIIAEDRGAELHRRLRADHGRRQGTDREGGRAGDEKMTATDRHGQSLLQRGRVA
jgi:hypothetical protein